ncbi:MAG: response regulator [Candidatus Obscuribacterales bacterium]|nr:response regulator [Candidatus Obscuribacterales bacterium]
MSWEQQFSELKQQFLKRAADRLDTVDSLIRKLAEAPDDNLILRQISQQFHWLAGSGGTYGFDDVTQWGTYGEELCDYFIKVARPVTQDDLDKLSSALETVRHLFTARLQQAVVSAASTADQASTADSIIKQKPADKFVEPEKTTVLSAVTAAETAQPATEIELSTPRPATVDPGAIPQDRPYAVLVDGNIHNLKGLQQGLEERGIFAQEHNTSGAAKKAIMDRLPDVLILSLPLPDSTGYELAEIIRAAEGGHRTVIIILGMQSGFLDKVQAIRSGADAFFEYPPDHSEVIQKVFHLLDRDKPEQYKILSVEDDPQMAEFIKLTLESAGYKIQQISDAHQFENAFLSFEPDLVLMDVMLGEMTGFELAKYIRQNDRFATLPIVFLTTQNKLHMHIRSARAGGDEHLVKPVAPQLLIATIAGRLEKARALKRLIDRDGLTRCLTYGTFMERAQRLANTENLRSSPAMMMMDIDHMKAINDRHGFAIGDRVISSIGSLLLRGFRNTDMIARYQSDRFVVIIEHLNEQQLYSLSSQVLAAIAKATHTTNEGAISVTCSAGLALLEPQMSLQQWVVDAERALKAAKEQGRNRAVVKPIVQASR